MSERPWRMRQSWHDLLFAHWPVDRDVIRAKVPRAFELDLWKGDAWIGIVPFRMTNVTLRGVPPLPWLSSFPELNVRTYVRVGDRPGVLFFSLDAGNSMASLTARRVLNLPYYWASMSITERDGAFHYTSRRHAVHSAADFAAEYAPSGPVFEAHPGTLEHFLTERYCLYQLDRRGVPYRLDIEHPPWPLQPATATISRNDLFRIHGVAEPAGPPLLHFSRRQDMVCWAPRSADS
jgi:uncharacterized protein YqjF (DUF2071 family)